MTPRIDQHALAPVEHDPADVEGDGDRDQADAEDGEEDDRPPAAADHASEAESIAMLMSAEADGRSQKRRSIVSGSADLSIQRFEQFSTPLLPAGSRGTLATLRSRTRPMALNSFSVIQVMSNSYQARPWRAETGCA